jgi:diketogulonate reductase-like aldo/keto reductase
MNKEDIDFVQFTYNILDDEAEQKLLPLAKEKKIAVIVNRPFQGGSLFDYTKNKQIPKWVEEYGIKSWSEFFLKFTTSHPAVTCSIPATSRLDHMKENMQSLYGDLPDEKARMKMKKFFKSIV